MSVVDILYDWNVRSVTKVEVMYLLKRCVIIFSKLKNLKGLSKVSYPSTMNSNCVIIYNIWNGLTIASEMIKGAAR